MINLENENLELNCSVYYSERSKNSSHNFPSQFISSFSRFSTLTPIRLQSASNILASACCVFWAGMEFCAVENLRAQIVIRLGCNCLPYLKFQQQISRKNLSRAMKEGRKLLCNSNLGFGLLLFKVENRWRRSRRDPKGSLNFPRNSHLPVTVEISK